MRFIAAVFLLLFMDAPALSQTVSSFLPKPIVKNGRYLFYLHGGSVTVLGDNSINRGAPEWGPYEYSNILDSLRIRGFYVVSERRFEHIEDSTYAVKISSQVDSLLKAGVPKQNIIVVSASAGWTINYRVSEQLRNDLIHFVKIGGCRPGEDKDAERRELHGHFLTITEKTDPRGSCNDLFKNQKYITGYKEVELNTGLNHGFFYKGRKAWIDPIVEWFSKAK